MSKETFVIIFDRFVKDSVDYNKIKQIKKYLLSNNHFFYNPNYIHNLLDFENNKEDYERLEINCFINHITNNRNKLVSLITDYNSSYRSLMFLGAYIGCCGVRGITTLTTTSSDPDIKSIIDNFECSINHDPSLIHLKDDIFPHGWENSFEVTINKSSKYYPFILGYSLAKPGIKFNII